MKIRQYFIAANILFLAAVVWQIAPERVFILQGQRDTLALRERQLAVIEESYRAKDGNIELLAGLQQNDVYIILPAGQTGAILTEVREMLFLHGLEEQEFFASEQAMHYIDGRLVIEVRATLAANGRYGDINAFLQGLADCYRYIRLEHIQISEEFIPTSLWLTFAIYEENN